MKNKSKNEILSVVSTAWVIIEPFAFIFFHI